MNLKLRVFLYQDLQKQIWVIQILPRWCVNLPWNCLGALPLKVWNQQTVLWSSLVQPQPVMKPQARCYMTTSLVKCIHPHQAFLRHRLKHHQLKRRSLLKVTTVSPVWDWCWKCWWPKTGWWWCWSYKGWGSTGDLRRDYVWRWHLLEESELQVEHVYSQFSNTYSINKQTI